MRLAPKPLAIPLSKRANVVYLEHARVMQKDDRVLYLTQSGADVDSYFNIPYRNTALLLLGQGTSITNSAIRKLAEENVIVGFSGTGGSPLHGGVDHVFLGGVSEYRPTEYMQGWIRLWLDEQRRLNAAKLLLKDRSSCSQEFWKKRNGLSTRVLGGLDAALQKFERALEKATTTNDLLSAEAVTARAMYRLLADEYHIENFTRNPGSKDQETIKDVVNNYLDHGNYIAYGYAAVALHALGISFALPVLHGKTRRGGLVFDIADLYKDALIMPLAFEFAATGKSNKEFRAELIENCTKAGVIDRSIDTIKKILA